MTLTNAAEAVQGAQKEEHKNMYKVYKVHLISI